MAKKQLDFNILIVLKCGHHRLVVSVDYGAQCTWAHTPALLGLLGVHSAVFYSTVC